MGAFDAVLDRVIVGEQLKTPDAKAGKAFEIVSVDPEGVAIRTSRGGRIKMSPFTFDAAEKYLSDLGCRGDRWLEVKDENFQAVLNMENDRVRAASYVLAILARAGVIDVDGGRPNRARLAAAAR
jgi:hypothetical protein